VTGRWFQDFHGAPRPALHGVEAVVRPDQAVAFAVDRIGLVEAERATAAADRFFRAVARDRELRRVGWRAVVLEQPDREGGQG
jgi:hypothetical protein